MAFSINTPIGDGSTTQFAVNFVNGIFSRDNVTVFVDGEVDGTGDPVPRTFTWISDGLIELDGAAPADGVVIRIRRIMFKDAPIVDYEDGEILIEATLDRSNDQMINLIQELLDGFGFESIQTDINMNGNKIINTVTDLSDSTSLVTVGGLGGAVDRAETAATESDVSASQSLSSASSASTSANSASTAAGLASDSADAAELAATQNLPAINTNAADILDRVIRVTSIAAMEAYSAPVGYVFSLNAGGRSGDFDVVAGDFSSELAADTLSGIYVALADDTAANTKAAVRRNISRVNVSWFGAVGDNTADDTDAIEAALEFKNVFLPEGDFRVTTTINIVSGVSIIGEGQLLSNIYFAPEAGEINLFLFGGSDFCNFSRFAVYGPGATGNAEQGFSLDDNDSSGSERQVLFSELFVKEFDGAGFALSGHWTVSISHSEIRNCGVRSTPTTGTGGIAFVDNPDLPGWSGSGTDINNCYFSGNSYGIYGISTWCALVRLCIFEYNAYAFFKNTKGKAITFDSCWFETNDFAPDVGGSVAIKNCRGYSTGGHNLTYDDQGVIIEDAGSLELYTGTTPFLKMNARDGFTTDITIQEKQVRNITDRTSVNVELPFSVNRWGDTATLLFDDVVSGNADIVIGEIYAAGKDANTVRKWTVYRESAGSAFTITTDIAAGSRVGGSTASITLSENGAGALELQGSWAFNGQGFFGYFKGLVSNT